MTSGRPPFDHSAGSAKLVTPADAQVGVTQLLVFELGPKRLALLAEDVVEVVRAVAISAVPRAPPVLEGVMNHRGRLVPVLDVRARFQVAARANSPDQHMIVGRSGPRLVSLRVDRAVELIEVDTSWISDAGQVVPEAELVAGVVRLEDGVLVVHDLERFLSAGEARDVDATIESLESADENSSAPPSARETS
jgi:purine-binding chemotaxis protein CheW